MQLFYIPGVKGDTAVMNETESRHCIRVLRMGKGEKIHFVDGAGGFYEGIIASDDPKKCMVKVTDRQQEYEKRNYELHIAIAPVKNNDRFEWFLEKATEIGIDTITPVICQRSERRKIREDRMEAILVSAMKQSVKAWKPVLQDIVPMEDFLKKDFGNAECFIAHCIDGDEREELIRAECSGKRFLIVIGPEGDFTPGEVESAVSRGFRPVSLGRSRLRTETAGVVAAQIVCDKMMISEKRNADFHG